jgi:hypothetical protein
MLLRDRGRHPSRLVATRRAPQGEDGERALVMAGLAPAIHVLLAALGREEKWLVSFASPPPAPNLQSTVGCSILFLICSLLVAYVSDAFWRNAH